MANRALKIVTNDSEWSRWYLVPEKNSLGVDVNKIKRYRTVDGKTKWQRYPAKNYRDMDQAEVEALLRRLNASQEIDRKNAEARYNFDHTYVNPKSLEAFEGQLKKDISDKGSQVAVFMILNKYVFEFFIVQQKLPDPSRWHIKENEWGEWLLKKNLSAAFLKRVVSTANRFNKFLIDKIYPEMQTPRRLEPIGRVKLGKMIEARDREIGAKSKYIKKETFEKLVAWVKQKDPEVLPNLLLCYAFGLRLSETLGLTKDKFLKDNLLVDEQGHKVEEGQVTRKSTKSLQRRVPYWNMTAKEAWALVKEIKVMHPDTLNHRLNACLAKYGHTSHDFRRTFITNAFRKVHWKDVQKAAGHTDVRVTMGYDQDDRDLSLEKADLD